MTPTLANERIPSKDELNTILRMATPRKNGGRLGAYVPQVTTGYALTLGWYANSVSLLKMPSVWASCSTVVFMSCS